MTPIDAKRFCEAVRRYCIAEMDDEPHEAALISTGQHTAVVLVKLREHRLSMEVHAARTLGRPGEPVRCCFTVGMRVGNPLDADGAGALSLLAATGANLLGQLEAELPL